MLCMGMEGRKTNVTENCIQYMIGISDLFTLQGKEMDELDWRVDWCRKGCPRPHHHCPHHHLTVPFPGCQQCGGVCTCECLSSCCLILSSSSDDKSGKQSRVPPRSRDHRKHRSSWWGHLYLEWCWMVGCWCDFGPVGWQPLQSKCIVKLEGLCKGGFAKVATFSRNWPYKQQMKVNAPKKKGVK